MAQIPKYLNLLELVVEETTMVKFKSAGHNCASNFGSISELGRQTTDFRANAKDILGEQPTTEIYLMTNVKDCSNPKYLITHCSYLAI